MVSILKIRFHASYTLIPSVVAVDKSVYCCNYYPYVNFGAIYIYGAALGSQANILYMLPGN